MKFNKLIILPFLLLVIFLGGCGGPPSDQKPTFDNEFIYDGNLSLKYEENGSVQSTVDIYRDSVTGCRYIGQPSYGGHISYSPVYNKYGQVDGCHALQNVSEGSKDDYLKLLSEHFPDKEKSELEYMLENLFQNKSIEELKIFLELMDKDSEVK